MGSYEEGGGGGLCFKAGVSWKSRWPEEYLRTDRQTDSAVTHKVESTTNSTGGCSVSYFMDECTVGFGDRATLRPPATALLHPGIKETGEHTSPFGQRPPERLSLPPQALCFLTPDNWGNTMAALLRSSLGDEWGWMCGPWCHTCRRTRGGFQKGGQMDWNG